MTQQYAISEYPDVDEIYAKLENLISQPLQPVRREKMKEYLDYFENKCARSKQLTDEAKQIIPGGVQHNLAFNYPFPIAIEKADGAYLWDADGNKYIDFLQAGGPTILGSNYAPVREKVIEMLQTCGPVTGLFHEYELKLAQLVQRFMPSIEMFRMLGSGTEGVMAAIRAARTFTKKKYVIKVGGAYHGWSDSMVYGLHIPGTGRLEAKGIPRGASASTREFYPNALGALKRQLFLNRLRGGTAAVIVEPVGPESGTRPVPKDFNQKVRELCDEFGALLIFDEVVTGFRLGLGGAQGYFNVKPDLTVFGKCITGGYPMAGGVGGRCDVIATFAAGIGGVGERAYIGGTLSANPLSCVAGYYALLEMEKTKAAVIAGKAGDRLTKGLQAIIEKYSLPFVAYNQGSIVHLETAGTMLLDFKHPLRLAKELKPRKHMMEEMGAAYMANGLITLAGSRMYTSMADTNEVIDDALVRFENVFEGMSVSHKLLVLAHDENKYRALIEEARLANLELATQSAPDVDIVLGEPSRIKAALASLPTLSWVQSIWAGVEPLLDPALRRDYVLTNARGVFGKLMSEYVVGYLLAHERGIIQKFESQKNNHWDHTDTGTLRGKTIGLLGVGSIGAEVALTAKFFGITVRGYTWGSETSKHVDMYFHPLGSDSLLSGTQVQQQAATLQSFVNGLDYLVSILPNTKDTRKIVNADLLNALPSHALFINVGRGSAVDESALIEALNHNRIAGAVLDVFEQEPLPKEHPFWTTPNLLMTFHTSAPSLPEDITKVFIENYKLFVEGKTLKYQVNFERGY